MTASVFGADSASVRIDPASGRLLAFGEPFVVQWHLTDRCNLVCRHCYRAGPTRAELSAAQRSLVLDQIIQFLRCRKMKGRLHIAGGEPFLCNDLLALMRAAWAAGIPSRVLSNGTRIEPAAARELGAVGCVGVQVSIEGPEAVHDAIRGRGSWRAAMHGVHELRAAGLQVTLAMTLHAHNLPYMQDVGRLAREHADRVYYSRLVPCGRGADLGGVLSSRQWWQAMRRARAMARGLGIPVALRDPTFRAFYASAANAARAPALAGCAAGHGTITIEADGSVMPCRRLGVVIGNVLADGLDTIWQGSEVLARLRDRDRLQGRCSHCSYRWVCGGCRAVALAVGGQLMGEDPQCPWSLPLPMAMAVAGRAWDRVRLPLWQR